jgi:hypothetical protein
MKAEGRRGDQGVRTPAFFFCLYPLAGSRQFRSLSAFCLVLLAGCAHYEYDVVEPPQLAGHVSTKAWLAERRDDLEYRMVTSDNRLVVHVYNRGERPVKLLGTDSAAVDARGESHPLRTATVPPGSYVKWIFPPPPMQVAHYGTTVGIGVGAAYGYGPGHGPWGYGTYHYHDPLHAGAFDQYGPRYYSIYDPNDSTYFDWSGESAVRFLFTFERENGERIRHEFLIRRRKV